MRIFLVQHGEAKSEGDDPDRSLTEKGIKDTEEMGEFAISHFGIALCEIYHSGKTRARQTAEILANYLSSSVKVMMQTDGLAPSDDPAIWAERIKKLTEDVFLVGHLPHLGKLASLLITGKSETKIIGFQNSCIVNLCKDNQGNWTTCWVVVPQII